MSHDKLTRWWRGAACVCAISAALPAQANCDVAPGVTRVEGRNAVVAFKTQPGQIKVGELFALDASLCAKNGGTLDAIAFKVDASMPEHRHGMNYQPSVVKNGGAYRANGLMFHMPGRWQFAFDVDTAQGRERILSDYRLD